VNTYNFKEANLLQTILNPNIALSVVFFMMIQLVGCGGGGESGENIQSLDDSSNGTIQLNNDPLDPELAILTYVFRGRAARR